MPPPPLSLHPLTRLPEGDGVLVGRADGESYAVLPQDGAALLERLIDGTPPPEAAAWYRDTYGETIDIDDFVSTLAKLGFVREPEEAAAAAETVGLRRLARVFLSRPAFLVYAAIVATWVWTMARRPELAPSPRHVFFTDSTVAVELLIVFGQLPWLFLHESFRPRARRPPARPLEPAGARNQALLRGVRDAHAEPAERRAAAAPPAVPRRDARRRPDRRVARRPRLRDGGHRARPRARDGVPRVHALRLPVPALPPDRRLLRARDGARLLRPARGDQARIANRYWRARRRPDRVRSLERWTERDRRVASWYEPFFAAGIVVLLGVWVFALLPVAEQLLRLVADALAGGTGDPRFWDAALFVTLNVFQVALLFHLSRRERRALTPEPA